MKYSKQVKPPEIAIVGSGPAGFFAAEALLRHGPAVRVHLFEQLPVPFGLVRYGVAPDRPALKSVARKFVATAGRERFAFHGNVRVGADVSVAELLRHFDAVILACGASRSRALDIPGETLEGSYSSEIFTGWYNGHPAHAAAEPDLTGTSAVIVGQGNVALDAARMLAIDPEALRETDMPAPVLAALKRGNLREIHVVGRRGPGQVSFSIEELEALTGISNCEVVVHADELHLPDKDREDVAASGKAPVLDALAELSAHPRKAAPRRVIFHFLRSPLRIEGDKSVEAVVLSKNILSGPPGHRIAESIDETERLPCDLFISCVGYRAVPIAGVPYDEDFGPVPNRNGRVTGLDRLYVAGWMKHGPRGLIGTAHRDSAETAKAVLEDLGAAHHIAQTKDSAALLALLSERNVPVTDFNNWLRIDAHEQAAGRRLGKPREKLLSVDDMLRIAQGGDVPASS